MNKSYLGDGVYVEEDDDTPNVFVLTTEDGVMIQNTIYMEPEVLSNFFHWIERINDVSIIVKRGSSESTRRD